MTSPHFRLRYKVLSEIRMPIKFKAMQITFQFNVKTEQEEQNINQKCGEDKWSHFVLTTYYITLIKVFAHVPVATHVLTKL